MGNLVAIVDAGQPAQAPVDGIKGIESQGVPGWTLAATNNDFSNVEVKNHVKTYSTYEYMTSLAHSTQIAITRRFIGFTVLMMGLLNSATMVVVP